MVRTMLTDEYWQKLRPIILQMNIYDKAELRNTIEGFLYRMRTGLPWRDLPKEFGRWNTIYKRFNNWSKSGKLVSIFKELSKNAELEWEFFDGTVIKTHQHGMGAVNGSEKAIGKTVGGNSTKIHMAVDSMGLPIHFEVTEGQVHDSKLARILLEARSGFHYIIADRGYDHQVFRDEVIAKNAIPLIPRKSNSKVGNNDIDWAIYSLRHLVENIFARIKHYRGIATRYDKLKSSYEGMVAMACSMTWLPHI